MKTGRVSLFPWQKSRRLRILVQQRSPASHRSIAQLKSDSIARSFIPIESLRCLVLDDSTETHYRPEKVHGLLRDCHISIGWKKEFHLTVKENKTEGCMVKTLLTNFYSYFYRYHYFIYSRIFSKVISPWEIIHLRDLFDGDIKLALCK